MHLCFRPIPRPQEVVQDELIVGILDHKHVGAEMQAQQFGSSLGTLEVFSSSHPFELLGEPGEL